MNYEVVSNETLEQRKQVLFNRIRDYEECIKMVRSQIYSLYYRARISSVKKEIHLIDAEIAFRNQKGE